MDLKSIVVYFQPSPIVFTSCIVLAAILNNVPRFFEFQLIDENGDGFWSSKIKDKGADYWTSDFKEDTRYVVMSSYNELLTTGIFPLIALCYYNYKIYARIKLSCFIDLRRYVGGNSRKIQKIMAFLWVY